MKQVFLLLAFQCISVLSFTQYTLQGIITDKNGEPLTGANVLLTNTLRGAVSNLDGKFKFSNLRAGEFEVQVSYIGYKTYASKVDINEDMEISIIMEEDTYVAEEIIVSSTRAKPDMPVPHINISKNDIADKNMGQDIPYILKLTPSFVSTSDAGTGIGYTNFKIRGTDLERINVTINGIPLNDAESHGVWWVDLPDFASSTENIQIQRGVGSSSNGAGAFGATINLQTSKLNKEAYAEYDGSFGSFNSVKNTVKFGTGLLNNKFAIDGRLSKISSDGYIDRGWSDLKSLYLSGAYYSEKNILKFNLFSGFEETYQAWNGVPKVRLENDIDGMRTFGNHSGYSDKQIDEMIKSDNRTYNLYTYENEIDHYEQNHYQLHYVREINNNINFNTAVHYTRGLGYYEQYKEDEDFSDYNLNNNITGNDTITSTDLIRRKWLDNHFYGITYSLIYNKTKTDITIGGGYHIYDGDHYGNIIWAEFASNGSKNYEWYRSNGFKKDLNIYAKVNYHLTNEINIYGDLQYRTINYTIDGIDDDLIDISLKNTKYDFINPKIGLFYNINDKQDVYFSVAVANREPKRADYVKALKSAKQLPTSETLIDYELGYNYKSSIISSQLNLYYMNYKDQLVQTGEINDVGDALLVNVDNSYRRGIECIAMVKPTNNLEWNLNLTLSQNKIIEFTEYVDNWDDGIQIVNKLGNTDISFSPSIIAGSNIVYKPIDNLNINLMSKYVGKQYIDNTSNDERSLDPYFVNDINIRYILKNILAKQIEIQLSVYNIFNEEYETNAWVYRYYLGGEHYEMDGYFPQAGRHIMAGIKLKF